MLKKALLVGAALAMTTGFASAKELKSIGVSLGSMGNPFFVALSKGAAFEAQKTNPNVKIITVGYDYDLGKQNTQIDNFIAAGVDLILLNPGDPKAIEPAIRTPSPRRSSAPRPTESLLSRSIPPPRAPTRRSRPTTPRPARSPAPI